MTCLRAFSRAWRRLPVFASRFDCFIELSATVVFGQIDYFSFGFTTLKENCFILESEV